MSVRPDSAATRPRSRRSIAHAPRSKMPSGLDKENATADIGVVPQFEVNAKLTTKDKKSRSKSLGPGGLDALQNSNGNRRKVGIIRSSCICMYLQWRVIVNDVWSPEVDSQTYRPGFPSTKHSLLRGDTQTYPGS